jgi:glutathione synthase/RimK-type ligase-like ATP-grasp enzyme
MNKTPSVQSKVLCLIGLPDNREVTVTGYDAAGKLIHSWDGNSDFHNQLSLSGIEKEYMSIIWHNEPQRQLKKPALLLNCINDPDIASKSLEVAAKITHAITEKWPDVPVFNDPEKVFDTARSRIYELYKDLPKIYIPKAIRFAPGSVREVMLQAQQIGYPFLIRQAGAHQSHGLQRIMNEADALAALEIYPYDGRNYYLTEFVDYKSADGLYRKCRLVIIGGKILPRHYMTGEDWLVHGNLHEQYMAHNPAAKTAEEHFIGHYAEMISPEALHSLMQIYTRSGLDYLGFDFAIRPDGSLLIFEINPAQNSFLKLDFSVFPYMKKVRDDLIAAVNDCIAQKLDRPRAA